MTAQPAGHVLWTPDPFRQRAANYTIEDVLELPDDAPRVELNDGVMVVVPSPTFQTHYWRIEQDPLHVFADDLVNGEYQPAGDSADELVLTAPSPITLPIADITP